MNPSELIKNSRAPGLIKKLLPFDQHQLEYSSIRVYEFIVKSLYEDIYSPHMLQRTAGATTMAQENHKILLDLEIRIRLSSRGYRVRVVWQEKYMNSQIHSVP